MNFKEMYKKENDNIKLDKEFIDNLSLKIQQCNDVGASKNIKVNNCRLIIRRPWIKAIIATVTMCFVIFIVQKSGIFNIDSFKHNNENHGENLAKQGIKVEKSKILNENEGIGNHRIETLIYNDNVYMLSSNKLSKESGEELLGNKLGETYALNDYVKETNLLDDNPSKIFMDRTKLSNFACTIANKCVYTVKGYDDFRLITYEGGKGKDEFQLWECLSDFTMYTGEDVFGRMNLKGNIKKIEYNNCDSMNNETPDLNQLQDYGQGEKFILALYKSTPVSTENAKLQSKLFLEEWNKFVCNENQKSVYLNMKDGTVLQLKLFKGGYVFYSGLKGFVFKVDENAFKNMWNVLK